MSYRYILLCDRDYAGMCHEERNQLHLLQSTLVQARTAIYYIILGCEIPILKIYFAALVLAVLYSGFPMC